MARLVLSTPEGHQVIELGANNSLGRHPSNSIQVLDKIVSKEHCLIVQEGQSFVLKDLGSLNGTYINAERVAGERGLKHGDEITMGSTRARFEDPVIAGNLGTAAMPLPVSAPAAANPPTLVSSQLAGGSGPRSAPAPFSALPVAAPAPVGPMSQPSSSQGAPQRRFNQTRVDVSDASRQIGTQINATDKDFLPYDQIATNTAQVAADYERLRLSHELSREIALERDLTTMLNKILISMFRFVRADRGVIFLPDKAGVLQPGASLRRDGSTTAITVSSTIMDHVIKERATVLTHDAAMDFAGAKGKSMILNRISSAIIAPMIYSDEIVGVLWLDSETLAQFQPKDLELVTSIAAQAAMFIEINILGQKVEQEIINRERFSRLLSPNVAAKVLSGEMVVKKGGQLVESCTVFNSDIRGFTQMSDGAMPELIVEMMNEYFELMVETIFKYEGTLDKFMGDGIMALWGAPAQHEDDALRSVNCAVEQMIVLGEFNQDRISRNLKPLDIGIGVHTGPVVAGYIGSSKALSYTVIGDTANTSARLCSVAGPGQILVSEVTLAELRGTFDYEELPPANLKGKEKAFRCFSIKGIRPISVQVPKA